ncbi:hypothetical protein [Enterococcus gallinarum]|uniref:hypothetical protein n=1 Tax=Enterococcus gallinarum TaxID=1353 RepID=UPI0021CD7F28|nr:hypothetical protein [Enterococcus gallinarum]
MVYFLHQQTIVLFFSKEQLLTIFDKELCQQEAAKISENQLEDGSLPIPWQWGTEYTKFYISVNWWKSVQIIKNFLFLHAFSK